MSIFGKTRHWLIAGLCAAMALGVGAPPAPAVVPGANGKIAFASVRDGNYEVYVMDADGSGQTRLTSNPADDLQPAWSPDGTKIAFTSLRDGNYEVYVMNADGSGQTNLTNDPADDEGRKAWSPDGTRIAFTSFRDGNWEVYVMNADGSGQTNLTNSPSRDAGPAWSPDGTKIAFLSDRDGNFEVYALQLSGQADVRRDSAQQFCVNGFNRARWASNGMPKTNDDGRAALLQVRQCVLYLMGPPAEVQTASAAIRLALIELVCKIAHLRYDEVSASGSANASRLVQAKTSLDQADGAPGTNGALFDCVNAWSILRNEPPQYTS